MLNLTSNQEVQISTTRGTISHFRGAKSKVSCSQVLARMLSRRNFYTLWAGGLLNLTLDDWVMIFASSPPTPLHPSSCCSPSSSSSSWNVILRSNIHISTHILRFHLHAFSQSELNSAGSTQTETDHSQLFQIPSPSPKWLITPEISFLQFLNFI